jgi:elongation factor G
VPESAVGTILSDLSGRRGKVLGTETSEDDSDRSVVHAEVPAAELTRYLVDLRSMTAGAGTFTRGFARYEPMPAHLADAHRKQH